MSLEHTHPPASLSIHGNRFIAQRFLKHAWSASHVKDSSPFKLNIQPITRRHPDCNPISDLFPWIISDNFDTCFQAHDIASLFTPSSHNTSTSCLLVVFNSEGVEILRKLISLQSLIKSPIQFSFLLRSYSFQYGTFAILHNTNPACLSGTPSVLTDRGYSYFINKSSRLRHYVHGNFDALLVFPALLFLFCLSVLFQYLFGSVTLMT